MTLSNEFEFKPVELFCTYDSTPVAVSSGRRKNVAGDSVGRLMVVGAGAANASTAGINPTLIAGVGVGGSITTIDSSGGTIQVNTELTLAADNVSIGNIKTFSNSSGTQYFGLVDSSRRIILAPSSTVVIDATSTIGAAIYGGLTGTDSTVSLYSNTSTVNVVPLNNSSATEIRAQVVGSTQLLSANSSRITTLIQNVSTVDAYIGFGASASTLGFRLIENGAYEINQTNMYNGAISIISESAVSTADIRIAEW